MSNVYSFNEAIGNGCEPREFPYDKELIPLGKFKANLKFKIWGKKVLAVNCYFTQVETNKNFTISVYKNRAKDEEYFVGESHVDFKICPIDQIYEITIEKTNRGAVKLTDIVEIN